MHTFQVASEAQREAPSVSCAVNSSRMEEDTDKEARSAAQGLLDIAIKASRRSVEKTGSRSEAEPAFKVPSHPEKGINSVTYTH